MGAIFADGSTDSERARSVGLSMKIFRKAAITLAIISILSVFSGCRNEPIRTVSDIESLSISCGDMDTRQSYTFQITRKSGNWVIVADYTDTNTEALVQLEAAIDSKKADELLSLVKSSGLIDKLTKYKKPTKDTFVSDEAIYSTAIVFSDGQILSAPLFAGNEIENTFRSLAENTAEVT